MPRSHRHSALLIAFLLAGACSDGEHPSELPRPNVLLIVVDTLRQDRLGCYGAERETSPAIDALAASGTLFLDAYAPSPWTKPSVASILTGRYPSGHGLTGLDARLPKGARSIAQLLRSEGYATAGVVSNKLVSKFGRGFETFDDSEARGPNHVSASGVTTKALELAHKLVGADKPFLLYVHYFDPHVDYKPHPELGMAPGAVGRLDGTQTWNQLDEMRAELSAREVKFVRDLYDGEVRYTDLAIDELLKGFANLGIDDRTIVILTSDHGEEILEHGNIGHTRTLYEELIRVPLIFRVPGAPAGRRLKHPVSLVALAPTVLELCGISPDTVPFQQVSLAARILGADEPTAEAAIFAEVDFIPPRNGNVPVGLTRKKSLRLGDFKIIADELTETYELFNLREDPGETHNLTAAEPERLELLRSRLDLAIARSKRGALRAESVDLSAEEVETLRQLGYVE